MKLFAPLYERVLEWSRHQYAERYLGALSFAESSFFPIPVDVMLAPMCLADRRRAWRYASVATVFSVLGGLAGYAIGIAVFDAIEPWLVDSRYWGGFETSRAWFDRYGIVAVFIAGFSPIPYKVFAILAGSLNMNRRSFLLASLVGRGVRFITLSVLVMVFGESMTDLVGQNFEIITIAIVSVVLAIVVGWIIWGRRRHNRRLAQR